MRYVLRCASELDKRKIVNKYPIIEKYNPVIDYPYPNKNAERLTIEVDDLVKFYYDIGSEIIIGEDIIKVDKEMLCITIYDDYME